MKNWFHDLFFGALAAFIMIFALRLVSIAFWGFLNDLPWLVLFLMWTFVGFHQVRKERVKMEIADLMTALRISLTGK